MRDSYFKADRVMPCLTVVLCCAAVLLFATTAFAQLAGTGNIQGTVTDSSGAVVPNAIVTLTNQATQVKRVAKTNEAGGYLFPGIPIGTYNVEVTAPSFKTYVQTGIVLEVGSNISVDPTLQVGAADVKVEVQAEGLALQTEDPTFKQTIDQNAVTEMPLNGRQMTALITLSGGSNQAPGGDFTGSKYSYQTISVSIAGGGGNTTLWRLDGGDNQDYMANGNLPYPFPDAVSQFSVESTALGAQDGGHVGGMVNVVTRSGTNQFHGAAFEFIRNNYINATNFYSSSPDVLHQNEFGGVFGGPIKRNKLFAFAGYQRLNYTKKQPSTTARVPTAANLAGDFSVTDGDPTAPPNTPVPCLGTNKTAIQLFDPLTGAKLVGNKYPSTPTWNAAAKALQQYLPKIDPAIDTQNCGVVKYPIPLKQNDNQFVTRVDWTINSKHNLYGRYFIDGYQAPAFFSPTNILITTQSGNIQRVQSFTMGEAYTINANVVNAAHVTLMRRVNNRGYNASDINANTLGITLYQGAKAGLQISEGKFTVGGGTNSLSHFNDNTLAFDDDVTWIHGKHQVNFGGTWVQNQLNIGNLYESNGTFTFNGLYSGSGPTGASGKIGDQTLDFLMGTLSAFEQSKQQQNALRGPIPSLYVQDTYHTTKNLTLVGGLRWGPNIMPHDYFNRGLEFNMANFLANKVSTVYPNAPAGVMYYGDPGVTRQFTQNSILQFSPNVGASFDPKGDGKTVIRLGGALMFDNPNFFTGQRNQQNPPYATAIANAQTSSSPPLSFSAPWSVGAITTSPFPQPQIPTPSQAQYFPQSQYIVMPARYHAAYTIQWTMSIQRQFPKGWQAQLDYIGNATRHDPIGLPLNPAVFIPGVWGAGGTGCTGIVTTGPAAVKPAPGQDCSTTSNKLSRYKLAIANPSQGNMFKGESSGSALVSDNGTANYNGLVATVQHRLSSTFSLLANWTWSKCLNIEDAQGDLAGTTVQDPNNPAGDYGPCGSDYRHIENASLVAKSNFSVSNRLERLAINNWEFAPLIHITSGAALNVTAGQDNSRSGVGNDRPNLVPGVNPYIKTTFRSGADSAGRQYLNPAAFAQVTAPCPVDNKGIPLPGCQYLGTFGNIRRNSFRTPPFLQFDAQISRIFQIHERYALDLRLEAFNVLNHPDFALGSLGSNQNFTSSTFGQVGQTASGNAAREFQGGVKLSF